MRKLVFLVLILCVSQMQSQELPDIAPKSPEAASLGKYGQVPVGLFTGTPQISIPLYELSDHDLSVAVSLNYSSNGVKVDEYSSSVGLGWTLIGGGVITRSVYDNKDENQQFYSKDVDFSDGVGLYNYLINAGMNNDVAIDTQPDIFSFNFNGYTGKFYLDDNSTSFYSRNIVFLEPSPLKIEIIKVNFEPHFKITAPNGISYYFGGDNAIEKLKNISVNCGGPADGGEGTSPIATSWFLTQMSDSKGNFIGFIYDQRSINYENAISQSVTRIDRLDNQQGCNSYPSESPCLNKVSGSISYLKEIRSVNGSIEFTYSQKENQPNGLLQLDNVALTSVDKEVPNSYFELSYDAVESTGGRNIKVSSPKTEYDYRIYLNKVQERSGSLVKGPYEFSYNSPEKLSSRFSFGQDYWGYNNGKNDNGSLIDNLAVERVKGNSVLYNALSNFKTSDRSPSSSKAVYGILSKVIYPTGGYNDFEYEGHSYNTTVEELPPKQIRFGEVFEDGPRDNVIEFDDVQFNHKAIISVAPNLDDFVSSPGDGPQLDFQVARISAFTIENGEKIEIPMFFEDDGNSPIPFEISSPYFIDNTNFSRKLVINVTKGKKYRLEIKLAGEATLATLSVSYYNQNKISVDKNIPVGGVRLKEVISENGKGKKEHKVYHYGTIDCLDCSSGVPVNRNTRPNITKTTTLFCDGGDGSNGVFCNLWSECSTATISSSTAFPLYNQQGYHIGYSSVIEELAGQGINGFTEHLYDVSLSIAPPLAVQGNNIGGMPLSNTFNFGRELQTNMYSIKNDTLIKVQQMDYIYKHDTRLDRESEIYQVRRNTIVSPEVGIISDENFSVENSFYDIGSYSILRQWHYLEKQIEKVFDVNGDNPVTTETKFYYDNPLHLQRTRTEVTDSNGNVIKTKVYFPDDVENENSLGETLTTEEFQAIQQFQKDGVEYRIGQPIQTETTENGQKTTQRTNFKYWNDKFTLPEYVQTAKDNDTLENRIVYKDYDLFGNPLEVQKTGGTPISYIWGHNYNYPIAKIVNATYAQIATALGISTEALKAFDESDLDTINTLRTALLTAQTTTFTYDVLVGVTSVTDPSGYTMTYEYDDFQRLKFVRDDQGKILSENRYHYKNN